MQDTERSYIEMHLMDAEPATKQKKMKGHAAADLWKQQLLKENEEKQSLSSRPIKKVVIVDPKQTPQKAKKAVFINHRRLEKREFGHFVESPPKPAETKPETMKRKEVIEYAKIIAASLKEKRKDIIRKLELFIESDGSFEKRMHGHLSNRSAFSISKFDQQKRSLMHVAFRSAASCALRLS